jgi:hypothetical protein
VPTHGNWWKNVLQNTESQLRDLTIFYAQNQHFLKIHNTDKKNSRPNFFYLIKL